MGSTTKMANIDAKREDKERKVKGAFGDYIFRIRPLDIQVQEGPGDNHKVRHHSRPSLENLRHRSGLIRWV